MTKERPILFSGPMVRALLAGTKTQTRRVIRFPAGVEFDGWGDNGTEVYASRTFEPTGTRVIRCPYGVPGDRLWVRETWGTSPLYDGAPVRAIPPDANIYCRATQETRLGTWRPSIFMPRWASRITLEVTEVRVQRAQDISGDDAAAEGVNMAKHRCGCDRCAQTTEICPATASGLIQAYAELWDLINEMRGHGWAINPWVWCVSFKRVAP